MIVNYKFLGLSSMPRLCNSYRLYVFIICFGIVLIILTINKTTTSSYINLFQMSEGDYYNYDKNETLSEKLAHVLPNIPKEFYDKNSYNFHKMYYKNSSCAPFPKLNSLEYSNIYWQAFTANDTTFQLYSAFYDTRKLNNLRNSVQIVSMMNNNNFTQEVFCQFWFENRSEPVITGTSCYRYIWYKAWGIHSKGTFGPYIVTCQLPDNEGTQPPTCVSLVEKYCDRATNLLRVIYDVPEKKEEFAVCVKGLDFYDIDISAKLVEWFEFLHLMGAHKIYLYKLQVHPNIEKVLKYYKALGWIDVTEITLPGRQPNLPILQHEFLNSNNGQQCWDELIPYNDCYYKNIYSYKYIAIFDVDEIIIPTMDENWSQLMKRVLLEAQHRNKTFASYNARNVYFLDDMTPKNINNNIPPYMHMVKHTYRALNFTDPWSYIKSFFDSELGISVHNHYPIEFSKTAELSYCINTTHAQMNHYRHDCVGGVNCALYRNHTIEDKTMSPFKDKLIPRVTKVLRTLKLI